MKGFAKSGISCRSAARAVAVLLVMVFAVLSAAALSACNKKPPAPTPEEERADAVAHFGVNVLAALGEGWRTDLSDEEIIELPDCGSYVEAKLWTEEIAEVLDASSLATAKIRFVAEFAVTDEGKAMLSGVSDNFDTVLDFVAAVGFTSADIGELGMGLLRKLMTDILPGYYDVAAELGRLEGMVIGGGQQDIAAARERVERVTAALGDTREECVDNFASVLASLDEAEDGLRTLFEFAFDTEQTLGTGAAGEGLTSLLQSAADGSGALADVSDNEMLVWLDGVLSGLDKLSATMTAEKLAQVKAALSAVKESFDGFSLPVDSVHDIIGSLGYLSSYVDELPLLLSYIEAACDVVYERGEDGNYDYSFIRKLKAFAAEEDEALAEINGYILAAELTASFADAVSAEDLKAEFKRIGEEGDRYKNIALYLAALMALMPEEGGEAELTDSLTAMLAVLLTEMFDSAFDNAWRRYTLDPENGANRLRVMSGLVLDFAGAINELLREEGLPEVEITVDLSGPYTAEWRAEVSRIAAEAVAAADVMVGEPLPSVAVSAIGEKIDEAYAHMDGIRKVAAMDYVTDASSVDAEAVKAEVAGNPVFLLITSLFMSLL